MKSSNWRSACSAPARFVRLFGSRTDDDRIGGDVDLQIEAGSAETATFRNELQVAAELKEKIGDVHVDVIVRPPGISAAGDRSGRVGGGRRALGGRGL
jgi:hypothetical protein